MIELEDEFLSEEDLDLANLSWEELVAYWNLWLEQAQVTNDEDEALYSHGVFERDPAVVARPVESAWTEGRGRAAGAEREAPASELRDLQACSSSSSLGSDSSRAS